MQSLQQFNQTLQDIVNRLARMEKILKKLDPGSTQPLLSRDWLDPLQMCRILNVSKRTLDNYRRRGFLPYTKLGGKVYYKRQDLENFLAGTLRTNSN